MPTDHCRHLKEDGSFCQMPALRERNYCYYHLRELGRRLRMAQEAARQLSTPLVLPSFDDMVGVNAGLKQVAVALTFKRIDQRTAGLLLYALQQAASNLKFMTEMAAASDATDDREFVQEYPGFEAEFGLPEGFDLETPAEVAFPAAPVEAESSPYRSHWDRINPEDIELEELLKNKGEEAYKKRQGELQTKYWKQNERHKRELNEARWLIEAHRRTYAPPPQRTKEEQRAYDLQIIAEDEAKHPTPKSAKPVDWSALRDGPASSPAAGQPSSGATVAAEKRDEADKKPPLAASEIEIKAEAEEWFGN